VELTRHFRAPRIVLALRYHGVAVFQAAIREKFLLAQWLYAELAKIDEVELPLTPELSVVAFGLRATARRSGQDRTQALLDWLLLRGRCYISATQWHGRTWLRACVLSFRTHQPEVAALLSEIRAYLAEEHER
jgi:glutamate/tyrosine decarboxylase-like PLP-dependent enzyme